MIELTHDELVIHFLEVHEQARREINFQRTLRIPDDGRTYPLTAGLGPWGDRSTRFGELAGPRRRPPPADPSL